jgi:CBS domain-containing protein
MARTVAEVMNPELVSAREDTDPSSLRHLILAMGITGVPVLDEDHRPVGELALIWSTPSRTRRPSRGLSR